MEKEIEPGKQGKKGFNVQLIQGLLTVQFVVVLFFLGMALTGLGGNQVDSGAPIETQLDPEKVELGESTLPRGVEIQSINAIVPVQLSGFDHVLVRLQMVPILCLALLGLFLMRRMVSTVAHGDPFIPANVRRLRQIGMLLLVSPVFVFISEIAKSELVDRSSVKDLALSGISLDFFLVVAGALVMVLAQVFAAGVQLREDAEGLV